MVKSLEGLGRLAKVWKVDRRVKEEKGVLLSFNTCAEETQSVSEGTFAEGEPEAIRRPKVAPQGPLWTVRASGREV